MRRDRRREGEWVDQTIGGVAAALSANALGVVFSFEVALDHGNPDVIAQRLDRRFEQRCLASTRRRHEVNGQHVVALEMLAIVQRLVIVRV